MCPTELKSSCQQSQSLLEVQRAIYLLSFSSSWLLPLLLHPHGSRHPLPHFHRASWGDTPPT